MRIALPVFILALTARASALPLYTGATTTDHSRSSSPFLATLDWLQGTLLGNATAAVAVFATALLVFAVLTGGINWRLVATMVLGCVLLLGSAAIVSAMQSATALAR